MTSNSISDLRKNYDQLSLTAADLAKDPMVQFKTWFDQALNSDEVEPNAMTLATATSEGRPSARTLLIKGLTEQGIVFYTNYKSRKGHELDDNPYGAALFYWPSLERQVRLEGPIEKISRAESEAYFAKRPRESQLGAMVSPQSEVIVSDELLAQEFERAQSTHEGSDIPCPEHWGGYCLKPDIFEFWQGRPGRLHDRMQYRQDDSGTWVIERLAP